MRHTLAAALTLALLAAAPVAAAEPTPEQHLSLEQGRLLAAHSLGTGKPELTLDLTRALLRADRQDHLAWYLRAAAQAQLKSPGAGRRSAARAYRFAPDSAGKFRAAQLAARLAVQDARPTLAQVWLRRTAVHAPDEISEKHIAADYKVLRRINPWSFQLRGELKPSNNVNNGADSTLEVIDGVPTLGRFGPRSVALEGTMGVLDMSISRRLHQSRTSLTTLSARGYLQRVALSSDAKAKAATLAQQSGTTVPRNSEFGSTYGEISLTHAFAVGPPERQGSAVLGLSFGTAWYGGDKSYDLVKLTARRSWQLSARTGLTLDGIAEQRLDARGPSQDGEVFGLGARVNRKLLNGDQINLSVALRDTRSDHVNTSSRTATLRLGYQFAKPLGPAKISTGLILGQTDYPQFIAGFPARYLPDGREDTSLYADVNLFFEEYDYAGFAPTLRLRAGKKDSNHSRFQSRELSLSLGIQSKF
ncbi:hypothetical protein [Phaeobacter inhibens]|uniref:hypothetical protein n=1 Tax=Phaeobacter inhibens TaxID=221822 RepID=UPI000C9BE054|nr:hypothetical protein [Phaeobacter inhibens]AUQ63076.1 hypothetical protein PhaeoP51_02102 [Phaeobacter inhibens]AUQ82980.1 hypothetical protein PhaeoP57_02061 [Phaeobacter inhibens]AUQ90741.1 hypothetical protein PhaeoP24_02135 [Phaeobacter inhibens]AUR12084.1 hypothetical protein PhaeoP48_02103 [Phaeobacter inhibens]MDO6757895.1 hypothetical protein [Phaeobacter inhibens]